ncbi:sacsin N-terminal ATP-binding-like domain-containing protein [Pontibacter oryzae]|uniref:ATP-binding protein n=1 Tax=Pontibacter oryzae TaxID=2304593 RepID=A0A399SJK7_9BACT|nr:hypothetical protein [Pontibacter oryzae]RIJ42673.1 hypothetical protein D1627_02115 [Pontibacter oryzae]
MTIQDFLSAQHVPENRFYGIYSKLNDERGYLNELISANECKYLIHPDTGRRMGVGIPISILELEDGGFYEFSIALAPESIRTKTGDKYYLNIDKKKGYKKLDNNPFQEVIKQRFERLDNPDANLIIASLLKEVGKGLYSSRKRMFFELLQNADDVPTSSGDVRFYLETKGDYLILMHDGLPFDKDDVESITSAAESTKQKRQDKTGYKGIGFKSVFTDSEEVIIKSGGFNFKFDRYNESYKSFNTFYFEGRDKYIKYPGLREDDQKKYASASKKFQGLTSIPWQLLPLWADTLPDDLEKSDFTKNNNVSIGLKIGANSLTGYENEIKELFDDGRFLLFLRNTSLVQFSNHFLRVNKKKQDDVVSIKLDFPKPKPSEFLTYTTKEFAVPVNDELIEELDIDLVRCEEEDTIEIGEKRYFFSTKDGKKLETIPPKIAAFKAATVSFAAPVFKGKVDEEPSFKKNERFSYFYTYLPMRENRLRLPFLVNADFIPSSNREELQGDNPWNHLLMGLIGKKMVEWVANLALQDEPNYLNLLLPNEMEAEDNDVTELVKYFNNSYLQAIEEVAFIRNEDGELQHQKDTVLDLIGITKVIPVSLYHEITGTGKKLPASDIDSRILKKEVFGEITKIGYAELLEALADDEKCLALKKWLVNVPSETIKPFINWVEEDLIPQCEVHQLTDKLTEVLCTLNLFQFNKEISCDIQHSFDNHSKSWFYEAKELRLTSGYIEWLNEKDQYALLITTSKLKKYADVLVKTGLRFSDDFSSYTNIINTLVTDESLNKNAELLYSKIKSLAASQDYNTAEAINLLSFIKSIRGNYYEIAISELAIFPTKGGLNLPLKALVHQDTPNLHPSFNQFYLTFADWQLIKNTPLADATITFDKVIDEIVCNEKHLELVKAKVNADTLPSFYEALKKYLDESEYEDLSRQSIEVICTSTVDELLFDIPGNVLYNDALRNLTRDEFHAVKEILEECSNYKLSLPVYEALDFIESAAFKCKDESVVSYMQSDLEVPVSSIDALIKYLKSSEHKEPLFNRVLLKSTDSSNIQIGINKTGGTHQVRANKKLYEYACSFNGYENSYFLLPGSIRDKALEDLKLMYERELIDHLLNEAEYDCKLVEFIEGKGAERELKFLSNISEIPLYTTDEGTNTWSLSTLNLIKPILLKEELSKTEVDLLNCVRKAITIDGKTREEYNTAQDVVLKSNTESNKQYVFELSQLIETNNKGLSIKEIKTILPKWSSKELEKLFEPHRVTAKEIEEIFKKDKTYSGYKLAFAVCLFDAGFKLITGLNFNSGLSERFTNGFLDEIKKQKAYHFLPLLKCLQVNNHDAIILDARLRLEGSIEEPPKWLETWGKLDKSNLEFLYKSGLKGADSDLIELRQQFLKDEFDDTYSSLIHSKEIPIGAYNRTLEWLVSTFEILSSHQAKAYVELCEAMLGKAGHVISHVIQESFEEDGITAYSFTKAAKYFIPSDFTEEEIRQVSVVANANNIPLIPSFCPVKLSLILGKKAVEIEKNVLDPACIEDAELWGNQFYQNWAYRDTYKIYRIQSEFSRMDTVFDEAIVVYETEEKVLEHDGSYYTNIQDDQELALSLQLSDTAHILELVKGIIADKSEPRRREEEDYDDPNYATEYEEIVRDFRDLDKVVQMSKNKEALQKGIIHLADSGFEFSVSFISGNAIYNAKKDGISYKFYFHSAVGGLLFLTPGIMEDLYESETGVIVLYPNGQVKHFVGIDELIENPENSYFLLRAKNNKDKEQFRQVISVARQYQSHFMFVTSEEMRKKLYDSREERKQNQSLKGQSDFDPSTF